MNQKHIILFSLAATVAALVACNSGGDTTTTGSDSKTGNNTASTPTNEGGDSKKGIGKYQNVQLTNPLDAAMIASGKNVYEVKCASCHKLTGERIVGPGWKGVTTRRTPEWIMNFVTNVDEMIEKDAEAQKMLEECLVRMPNQNLSEADARSTLEFMRQNDGQK